MQKSKRFSSKMPVSKRKIALQSIQDVSDCKLKNIKCDDQLNPLHNSNRRHTSQNSSLKSNKTEEKPLETKSKEQIKIIVSRQDHTKMVAFIMRKDDQMKRIFNRYASLVGVNASCLRFLYDGYRIDEMDTPKDLNIENDNIIEVYRLELEGGKCYFKLLSSK